MMRADVLYKQGHQMFPTDDEKRVRDLGTYEMIWDCKFCGAQALPARTNRFCPNCGSAQDPKTRRFPSDEEKRAIENYVPQGADKICPACSTSNHGDAAFCVQCGAALDGAQRAAVKAEQVRQADDKFAADEVRDLAKEQMQADLGRTAAQSPAPPRGMNWMVIVGIVVALLVCGGLLAALFWTRPTTATVSGHQWQREIMIEAYRPVDDSAWCDSLPADAYNVSSRQEQRDTRQVPDGETCQVRRIDNGDGSFSEREECQTTYRSEPVYDDRCYFTINRWGYSRSVTTQGMSMAQMPSWGPLQLSMADGSGLGREREAGRSEEYILTLRDANGEYQCPVDFETWQAAREESSWTLEVSAVTGAPSCDTLAPAG